MAYAYAALGCQVPMSYLYDVSRARACRHDAADDAKYCPECGEPAWEDVYTPAAGYDNVKDELHGHPVVMMDSKWAAVCVKDGSAYADRRRIGMCILPEGLEALRDELFAMMRANGMKGYECLFGLHCSLGG